MSIYTRVSDSCSMKKLASTAPPQIQYTYVRFIYRMGAVLCGCTSITLPYSSIGRTLEVKSCTKMSLSILIIIPTVLLMCWLKVNLILSTTTPRSFSITVSSSCTIVPSSAVILILWVFVSDPHSLALLWVEFKLPFTSPFSDAVNVLL